MLEDVASQRCNRLGSCDEDNDDDTRPSGGHVLELTCPDLSMRPSRWTN